MFWKKMSRRLARLKNAPKHSLVSKTVRSDVIRDDGYSRPEIDTNVLSDGLHVPDTDSTKYLSTA